jgi:hypothetical protein
LASRWHVPRLLRHELHRYTRIGIGILEIEDELGKVLDRVDVVVGWWGDEAHTWCGLPYFGYPGPHFFPREVTSLAGFSSLGYLDLYLGCTPEITARHVKAT